MAHGDYACCAVCDCKMYYDALSAEVKTQICSDCAVELAKEGVFVKSGDELIAWMKANKRTAKEILDRHHFTECFYGNAVDQAYVDLSGPEEEK